MIPVGAFTALCIVVIVLFGSIIHWKVKYDKLYDKYTDLVDKYDRKSDLLRFHKEMAERHRYKYRKDRTKTQISKRLKQDDEELFGSAADRIKRMSWSSSGKCEDIW